MKARQGFQDSQDSQDSQELQELQDRQEPQDRQELQECQIERFFEVLDDLEVLDRLGVRQNKDHSATVSLGRLRSRPKRAGRRPHLFTPRGVHNP